MALGWDGFALRLEVSLRGRPRRRGLADNDRLNIDELLDAVHAELTPITAAFDPSKRDSRVGSDHAIDEDAAGFDLPGQLHCHADVACPQRRAETVQCHQQASVSSVTPDSPPRELDGYCQRQNQQEPHIEMVGPATLRV